MRLKNLKFRHLVQDILPRLAGAILFFRFPHRSFMVLALLFGLFFTFITPPFNVPDEFHHYIRAVKILYGHTVEQKLDRMTPTSYPAIGEDLPMSFLISYKKWGPIIGKSDKKVDSSFYIDTINAIKQDLKEEKKFFAPSPGASLYSPILYAPQLIGLRLGSWFPIDSLTLLYFGRLTNLLTWIGLMTWAIKQIPYQKWSIFLLALTPMSLFQASSFSADAIQNGLSFLSVALIIKYIHYPKNLAIPTQEVLGVGILSILLGLCKAPYFITNFLFLLVPQYCFRNISRKPIIIWILRLLPIILSVTFYLLWSRINYLASQSYSKIHFIVMQVDPVRQIQNLMNNPHIVSSLWNNAIQDFPTIRNHFVGVLGCFDTILPEWLYRDYLPILGFSFLIENRKPFRSNEIINPVDSARTLHFFFSKLFFAIIFSAEIIISYLALYLIWTPIGGDRILGLQGRYLIPISALMPYLFRFRFFSLSLPNRLIAFFIVPYSSVVLYQTFVALCERYYGGITPFLNYALAVMQYLLVNR